MLILERLQPKTLRRAVVITYYQEEVFNMINVYSNVLFSRNQQFWGRIRDDSLLIHFDDPHFVVFFCSVIDEKALAVLADINVQIMCWIVVDKYRLSAP